MSVVITREIEQAYEKFLDEAIDRTLDGRPITRREVSKVWPICLVTFAAGWQAGYEFGYMKGACDEHNS